LLLVRCQRISLVCNFLHKQGPLLKVGPLSRLKMFTVCAVGTLVLTQGLMFVMVAVFN
jgi:hypothetical protein